VAGKKRLRTTMAGLLVHVADHTQRWPSGYDCEGGANAAAT